MHEFYIYYNEPVCKNNTSSLIKYCRSNLYKEMLIKKYSADNEKYVEDV